MALAVFGWLNPATSNSAEVTFDESGIITTPIGAGKCLSGERGIAERWKDGRRRSFFTPKISEFALARFNTDGSLDRTLGGSGKLTTAVGQQCAAKAVAIQSDNKIVLAGTVYDEANNSNFALMRYNPRRNPRQELEWHRKAEHLCQNGP